MAKMTPQVSNFVSQALGAGYAMNEVIDYITGIFSNPGATTARARMVQKQQQGMATSDEEALLNQAQQQERTGKIAQAIPAIAQKTALPLTAIANIPALAQGVGGILGKGAEQQTPKVPSDVFLQKSPKLGLFIEKQINSGFDPITAAQKARAVKALQKEITDVESSVGQKLEDVVAQVFGSATPNQQSDQSQSTGDTGAALKELGALMQQYMKSKGIK